MKKDELCDSSRTFSLEINSRIPRSRPDMLRTLLHCFPQITILRLHSTATTSYKLLARVRLPNLTAFESNLPHGRLIKFLKLHPLIDILTLTSPCRRGICPLKRAFPLTNITAMSGTIQCAVSVMHADMNELVAQAPERRDWIAIPAALRSFPQTHIVRLTLDIRPEDLDMLQAILYVAPGVVYLRILEKRNSTVSRPQLYSSESRCLMLA